MLLTRTLNGSMSNDSANTLAAAASSPSRISNHSQLAARADELRHLLDGGVIERGGRGIAAQQIECIAGGFVKTTGMRVARFHFRN